MRTTINKGAFTLEFFKETEKSYDGGEIIEKYRYYQLFYKGKKVKNFFIVRTSWPESKSCNWSTYMVENEGFVVDDPRKLDKCLLICGNSSKTLVKLFVVVQKILDKGFTDNGEERLKSCPNTYRKFKVCYI